MAGAPGGPSAPLIVVSGGKGGMGTTTIAVNLAVALARQGRRAVFVDGDLDHGGRAPWSQHPQRGSVVDVLAGRRSVHEVLERGPSGIQVLSGAWNAGSVVEFSPTAQQRFVTDLKRLAPHAEVIVIDAGSGRTPFVRRFWDAAGVVLLVTNPDSIAIMESYATIKVLLAGEAFPVIHTLVNRSPDAATGNACHARLAEACRRFLGLRALPAGQVPPCEATHGVEPILIYPPRGEAARAVDRVSDAVWAQLQLSTGTDANARRPSALSA